MMLGAIEVHIGAPLAKRRVDMNVRLLLLERIDGVEDVAPLLRQQPARRRSGNDVRSVEHAHAVEWPRCESEGFGIAVANLLDVKSRAIGEIHALRMGEPFFR